nr:glycosyltransferase [Allomuricauda sp.]
MKVVKELPITILKTFELNSIPIGRLKHKKSTEIPIIVSLTSIPSRLSTLHLVIRSLLVQDKLPKKILLWLNEDLKNQLPHKLKKLEGSIFEIRFSHLTCPHRKLIHTLEAFPNDVIVTCDDDLMYRKNWLSSIHEEHLKRPRSIVGNYTVHINHDKTGKPVPFKKWKYPANQKINPWAITPIGAWGVLYPPKSLSSKTLDQNLFLKLAPKADDLWFKAMAVLQGTKSVQAVHPPKHPVPIGGTQKLALKNENLGGDKNTQQWIALEEAFNLSKLINQNRN